MGLSQPHPSFSGTLIWGVKSHSHEGGPGQVPSSQGSQGGPSKLPLRPPWRLGCPVWSRAPKCDALLRAGLVGPAADWTPSLPAPPHSLHPPRIGKENAPTSRQPAGSPSGACTPRLSLLRAVLIVWVSFPLCLTGNNQTPPLTNLRITAQSLARLALAAQEEEWKSASWRLGCGVRVWGLTQLCLPPSPGLLFIYF